MHPQSNVRQDIQFCASPKFSAVSCEFPPGGQRVGSAAGVGFRTDVATPIVKMRSYCGHPLPYPWRPRPKESGSGCQCDGQRVTVFFLRQNLHPTAAPVKHGRGTCDMMKGPPPGSCLSCGQACHRLHVVSGAGRSTQNGNQEWKQRFGVYYRPSSVPCVFVVPPRHGELIREGDLRWSSSTIYCAYACSK